MLLFKKPAFCHENEYRICLVAREEEEDLSLLLKSRSCAWSEDKTLPYIELPLHFDGRLLKSVMSGPRSRDWADVSKRLRERIERAGGDASIVGFPESKNPLRY